MENGIGSSDCSINANCGKRKCMYILALVSVRLKLTSMFFVRRFVSFFLKEDFFSLLYEQLDTINRT